MIASNHLHADLIVNQDAFEKKLVKRLKLRKTRDGKVFTLDLRHRDFGNQNPRFVRCPSDAGWPNVGTPTADPKTAARWVREAYAPWLYRERQHALATPGATGLTFGQAAEEYVRRRLKQVGEEGFRMISSRISMLRRHVVPALGHLPIHVITCTMIAEYVNAMIVSKPAAGRRRIPQKASAGTRKNFVRAATAVWNCLYPNERCPYAGIEVTDFAMIRARRQAILSGNGEQELTVTGGALSRERLVKALTGAMHYDREMSRRPNTRVSMVPNTTLAMVLHVCLGLRIAELRPLRWRHINENEGYVLIGGTKSLNALRIVPLQQSLIAWLREWKEQHCPNATPDDFVIRTHARARPDEQGSMGALAGRYTKALLRAGVKPQGKETHWARATHISWAAESRDLTPEALKRYVGHGQAYGGATDGYVATLVDRMPKAHRHYMDLVPSPDEIRKALKSFTPIEPPNWRERRTIHSRTKEALAAQHARAAARVPLGARLRG